MPTPGYELELRRQRYRPLFVATERTYGLPAGMLEAVARQESGFRPDARGTSGELGMMQFLPDTGRAYGVPGNLRASPFRSINAAGRLLRDLGRRYEGDWDRALAAYNAGHGAVDAGRIPASTRQYVAAVRSYWQGSAPSGESTEEPDFLQQSVASFGAVDCDDMVWWNPTNWPSLVKCAVSAATPLVLLIAIGGALAIWGVRGLADG